MRWTRTTAVCMALLAPALGSGEQRQTRDEPTWGFFAISDVGRPLEGLPLVSWTRYTGMHWPKLERPTGSGHYDWKYVDGLVSKAQGNGTNAVFVLKTGNDSRVSEAGCYKAARKGKPPRHLKSCPIKAEFEPAWKRLVAAIIERYDGDGKGDMPGLASWFTLDIQVENEAGSPNYWYPGERDGERAAQAFLSVLRLAYEAKESANPSTRIIAPGIIQPQRLARCARSPRLPGCSEPFHLRNRDFTVRLLESARYFDAVDVHFFNYFRFDPFFIPDGMKWVREQMARAGTERPIYSLEWTGAMMMDVEKGGHGKAFLAHVPFAEIARQKRPEQVYKNLSEPRYEKYRRWLELEQAREFTKLFTTMLANGVERLIHVQFHDYAGQGWNSVWWNWQGIIRYEGTRAHPVLIRKPAYYTYRALAENLAGFQDVEVVSFSEDYVGYRFRFPDREAVGVAWAGKGERTVDISGEVKAERVKVTPLLTEFDTDDRPILPKTESVSARSLRLTETPVLIEAIEKGAYETKK